ARELAETHGAEVRRRAGQVAREVAKEERAVAALEPDLVVVDDDRGSQPAHASLAATPRARASSPGVLTFMKTLAGSRDRATWLPAIGPTGTSSEKRTGWSRPATSR